MHGWKKVQFRLAWQQKENPDKTTQKPGGALTFKWQGDWPWIPAWVVKAWYLWDRPSVRVSAVGTGFLEGDVMGDKGPPAPAGASSGAEEGPNESQEQEHKNEGEGRSQQHTPLPPRREAPKRSQLRPSHNDNAHPTPKRCTNGKESCMPLPATFHGVNLGLTGGGWRELPRGFTHH